MRKNITLEMVEEFNLNMENQQSAIRLSFEENPYNLGINNCKISLPTLKHINSFIINPNEEFYDELKYFFFGKNIKLNFNNTGTTFWGTQKGENENGL